MFFSERKSNPMHLIMLKCKLHMARVTDAQLDYHGSLTIDAHLMEQAGLLPYEKILVANVENGERFETYAIPGRAGSGEICLNGAAARKGKTGDRLIIFAFALMSPEEAARVKPVILCLDAENRIVETIR